MAIHVGTSGWRYGHWRARFYPPRLPQARWLSYYAARFRVVEVNNTFYRLPERATFERWAAATPADFRFALKASRFLTHIKRLEEPGPAVERFMAAAAGLGDKRGPLLLQLAPNHRADAGRLEEALAAFPASAQVAVEPRHPSWFADEVRRVLEARGAALCLADRGGRPVTPLWRTARWGYLRLHGGAASPPGGYGRRSLETWAARIAEIWRPGEDVFVFFNNDGLACALRDAVVLADLLASGGRRVSAVAPAAEVRAG